MSPEPETEAPLSPADLGALEAQLDTWVHELEASLPAVAGIERGEPGERRWYVRLDGEEKTNFSVWLTLGQRTLSYETYFMPAPEENHASVFEYLLRRNQKMYGASFQIGSEDAVYLAGQLDNRAINPAALDRIVGSLYVHTEECFRPAMRIGYASRFEG